MPRVLLILILASIGCAPRAPVRKAETKPIEKPRVETAPAKPDVAPTRKPEIVIDSAMTPEQALSRNNFPKSALENLELITVRYIGFDEELHQGQIVVHRELAQEVKAIFREIESARSPIEKVIPIVRYGWDDDRSMAANNTSGFNYRRKNNRSRGSLSNHALGRAIDINPKQNPYFGKSGGWPYPYRKSAKGTLSRDHPITVAFRKRGWSWGGTWTSAKDYQHFEKR